MVFWQRFTSRLRIILRLRIRFVVRADVLVMSSLPDADDALGREAAASASLRFGS